MKISIITVSFNSEQTIKQTIHSILDQTYQNIECIFIDGLSRDQTISHINSMIPRLRERGIETKFISEKDNGIYDAMNKGINAATGEIVGFLNSDDSFYGPNVVKTIADCFSDPKLDCVFADVVYVDPYRTSKITRAYDSGSFYSGKFRESWSPAHPTFYCRKKLYDQFGLYRTDLKITADIELMHRFLEIKLISWQYINQTFVKMTAGGLSSKGLVSKIAIGREVIHFMKQRDSKFSTFRYWFYKALKMRQLTLLSGYQRNKK